MGEFIFMFVFHMWMKSKSYISDSSQRILNKVVADHFWYSCFLGLLVSVTAGSWHAL